MSANIISAALPLLTLNKKPASIVGSTLTSKFVYLRPITSGQDVLRLPLTLLIQEVWACICQLGTDILCSSGRVSRSFLISQERQLWGGKWDFIFYLWEKMSVKILNVLVAICMTLCRCSQSTYEI